MKFKSFSSSAYIWLYTALVNLLLYKSTNESLNWSWFVRWFLDIPLLLSKEVLTTVTLLMCKSNPNNWWIASFLVMSLSPKTFVKTCFNARWVSVVAASAISKMVLYILAKTLDLTSDFDAYLTIYNITFLILSGKEKSWLARQMYIISLQNVVIRWSLTLFWITLSCHGPNEPSLCWSRWYSIFVFSQIGFGILNLQRWHTPL